MTKEQNEKIIDCVAFKHELHERAFKASGACNFDEYIKHANETFLKSHWHKQQYASAKQNKYP
jgi:hypothetical protein